MLASTIAVGAVAFFAAKFLKTKFLSNSGEHGIETLSVVNWGDLPRKSLVLSSPAAIAFPVDFISRYEHGNFLKISYKTENKYIDTFTSEDLQRAYDAIEINEDGRDCSVKNLDYEFLHDKYQHIKNTCYSEEREWRLVSMKPNVLR